MLTETQRKLEKSQGIPCLQFNRYPDVPLQILHWLSATLELTQTEEMYVFLHFDMTISHDFLE